MRRCAATGPIAPLLRNGGYVAHRGSSSLKARTEVRAGQEQDMGRSSRLRSQTRVRLECPTAMPVAGGFQKAQADLGQAGSESRRNPYRRRPQQWVEGGGRAASRRTPSRRDAPHPPRSNLVLAKRNLQQPQKELFGFWRQSRQAELAESGPGGARGRAAPRRRRSTDCAVGSG